MPVTTIETAIYILFNGCDDYATVVFYYRRCWLDHFCDALYTYGAVRRNFKVFRNYVVGIAPAVVGAVDAVVINEGGVTATVGDIASVDAFLEWNIGAAVGNDGQGGGVDLRDTVNISGIVGCRSEAVRIQGVSESPDGVVFSTVGVAIAEDHRSCTVGVDVGGAVHKYGNDAVAAHVGDGISGRSHHIHKTSHGGASISGYTGDDIGQFNVEGEGPRMGVSSAVGVWIAVYDVALAVVEARLINACSTWNKGVATGIGNCRHGDAVGGDSI